MLNHLRNLAVWLSLATVGAWVVLPVPVAAEDTAPTRKITRRVPPVMSTVAKQSGISGTVKLVALVSPEGNVTSVRLVGGNPLFVAAAADAVKQWKFAPAKAESAVVVAVKFENSAR